MQKMTKPLALARALAPVLALAMTAEPALAYVGPGSSLGAVGVVFGLIGTIILSLLSFIWYPLKRLYRKLRKQASSPARARIVSRRSQQP